MWSRRRLAVFCLVGLAGLADAGVAARAGAELAPTPATAHITVPARATRKHPSSTTTTSRPAPTTTVARPAPKPKPRPRPAVRSAAPAPKLAARPQPAPQPAVLAAALAPASCPAVLASIVWPAGWHTSCAGPRDGILGLSGPGPTTTLYIRPGETAYKMRIVALHEAGHAWDLSHLTQPKIQQWCAARGCDAAHFFSGGARGAGWSEPGGAEDWAASWDACHGGEYHRSYIGLPAPTGAQCALQNSLVGYPG